MTNEEFKKCQDEELQMSGRDLAKRLGVTPSSISHWREDREVPPYIVKLLEFLCAEKNKTLALPLPLDQLIGLSRAAERRGITVETLLLNLIRNLASEPAATSFPASSYYLPAPDALKVAEDPTSPPITTTPKVTAYKPILNKPAKD